MLRWIAACYEAQADAFFPVAAIRVPGPITGVSSGQYVYAVQFREFSGLRRQSTMVFKAIAMSDGTVLGDEASERLATAAAAQGEDVPNARNRVDVGRALAFANECEALLLESSDREAAEFRAENDDRCTVQEEAARQFHERRVRELRERIERFRRDGRTSMIPPTEGLIRRLDDELELKRRRIAERRHVDETLQFLAVGVIHVG
jgi:hypothetical protein